MIVLDAETARANIAAMLVHFDDDAAARESFRQLRVANRLAGQLLRRMAVLGCDGLSRAAIIEALINDPAALQLCSQLFAIATIGGGWEICLTE